MKTRQGLVSNSSTTSFAVYGIEAQIDYERYEEIDALIFGEGMIGETDVSILEMHRPDGSETYIGANYANMDEDETKRQFEARVCQALDALLTHIHYEGDRTYGHHSGEYWS